MHSLSTKRYKDGILKVDKPVYLVILIMHSYMLSCIVQYYFHLALLFPAIHNPVFWDHDPPVLLLLIYILTT